MEIWEVIAHQSGFESNSIWKFIFVASRLIPILVFVPAFGGQLVPVRFRIAITIVIAVAVAPLVPLGGLSTSRVDTTLKLLNVVVEFFAGMMISLVMSLVFYIASSSGEIIDTLRGQTLAQVLVPQMSTQSSQFAQFFLQFTIVVFFVIDAHHFFIDAFIRSYSSVPIMEVLESLTCSGWRAIKIDQFLHLIPYMVESAILLAAPVVIVMIIIDLMLGIVNRIVPPIQVFQLGLPVKMWIGIGLVFLYISIFSTHLKKIIFYIISVFLDS
jgi:type III secretory pathway component EscT